MTMFIKQTEGHEYIGSAPLIHDGVSTNVHYFRNTVRNEISGYSKCLFLLRNGNKLYGEPSSSSLHEYEPEIARVYSGR